MSSLRKAYNSRIHKERHQPQARKKFGLLPKRKDYSLRAKNFHNKADRLRILRHKSETRNPDEFYYGMINVQTEDGIHHLQKHKQYAPKIIKQMKTQDLLNLRMHRNQETKKLENLTSTLHRPYDSSSWASEHILFDDEAHAIKKTDPMHDNKSESKINFEKQLFNKYKEIDKRIERLSHLKKLVKKADLEVALMGKGKRRKVSSQVDIFGEEEDSTPVYKWKKQRKK